MKISNETVAVLQNFTNINPSILIQEGSVLRTIDFEKTVFSSANVKEEFPKEFAIYDLPNFLQVIKMLDGSELDFGDEDTNHCMISYENEDTVVRYMYASPEAVEHVKQDIVMPETEINFILDKEMLAKLTKAAVTLDLPHIMITPDGEDKVTITVTNIENPSSNIFRLSAKADLSIGDFDVIIDFAKFMSLMEGEYNVGISSKEISHFYNDNVQYWLALNANSKFGV